MCVAESEAVHHARWPYRSAAQFGHRADDDKQGPPHGAVGVDLILRAGEALAEMVGLFERRQQMGCATGEAVELPYEDAVGLAVSCRPHQRDRPRQERFRAGHW